MSFVLTGLPNKFATIITLYGGSKLLWLGEQLLLWNELLLGLSDKLLLNWGSKLLWGYSNLGLGSVDDSKSFRGELWLFVDIGFSSNLLVHIRFSWNLHMLIRNDLGSSACSGSQAN